MQVTLSGTQPKLVCILISGSINMHHPYFFHMQAKTQTLHLHLAIKEICLKMCIILRIIVTFFFTFLCFYTLYSAA